MVEEVLVGVDLIKNTSYFYSLRDDLEWPAQVRILDAQPATEIFIKLYLVSRGEGEYAGLFRTLATCSSGAASTETAGRQLPRPKGPVVSRARFSAGRIRSVSRQYGAMQRQRARGSAAARPRFSTGA